MRKKGFASTQSLYGFSPTYSYQCITMFILHNTQVTKNQEMIFYYKMLDKVIVLYLNKTLNII